MLQKNPHTLNRCRNKPQNKLFISEYNQCHDTSEHRHIMSRKQNKTHQWRKWWKSHKEQVSMGVFLFSSGLWFSSNLHSSDLLSHGMLFAFILKLAVISFFLEELDVVVFAVKLAFMCNIIRWAYGATSMCAFEAAPVVWGPIDRNLWRQ